jgi:mono/diheme cytochrome c family protein/glucose/arabinose dehydrogenase
MIHRIRLLPILLAALMAQAAELPPRAHAPLVDPTTATTVRTQGVSAPADGERIVLLGNGLAERDVYYGRLEAELHLRFPDSRLVVRNMGRPGDTPGFRPHPARVSQWAFPGAERFHPELKSHFGKGFFPTPDQWLTHLKADTILAFFGYNESFDGPGGVANFEAELDAWVSHTLTKAYNGVAAPRLVLVSPIAFEDLSGGRDLPDGKKENANLALYTEAMRSVAKKRGIAFVDLFTPTRLRGTRPGQAPLTINGFAPTEAGYVEIAGLLSEGAFGKAPRRAKGNADKVLAAVREKDWFWNNDYNLVNGVHTHGQRYDPFGPQNYPFEILKSRAMTVRRDALIHEVAAGRKTDLAVDDAETGELPSVPTNFRRPIEYLDGTKAIEKMTVMPGYKVELFASEKEFPDLKNPVQMSFDNRGRLWVAVMPSYPHFKPGDPRPDDKLLILEDTDNDGKADTQKIFARGLHLPIGFELAPEGVYLSQEPNLCLLVDDNHDDVADRMEILMHGFDTHDTHHAISAYSADASGAFYLLEGRFLHSQVETPYGPRRVNDGGAWRFDPKNFRLERFIQSDVNNPWGIAFDDWEQCVLSDASSGENYWALPISAKMPYGVEIDRAGEYVPKRSRPTSGSEFVSSRHFPEDRQGQFMTCNSIGFLGINFSSVREDGSGFTGALAGDLISSSDPNFRPVDLEFAPDGSLYFIDWHNALIGHMQHNARDPNRDHDHGRVYRVTYPSRPMVKPTRVAGATVPELLEALKSPEYRTRYRARRELRGRPAAEVLPAVKAWASKLDRVDARHEHHLCEALWATWSQNQPDAGILRACLNAKSHQARAAAVQVLRHAGYRLPEVASFYRQAVNDPHPRVRLEAMVAASWLDNELGARLILDGLRQPLDKWMIPVTRQMLQTTLKDDVEALVKASPSVVADNPNAQEYLAGRMKLGSPVSAEKKEYGPTRKLSEGDQKLYLLGKEVFHRDAHCATCHQSSGTGVQGVYPPLNVAGNPWLADEERLVKVVLKGLWGPLEIGGQRFGPTNGVPPMLGFAGMLTDEEAAGVLTYVRQSFGNDFAPVAPSSVARVRAATKGRADFYMVEEIMKEHPISGWEKWGRMARPAGDIYE